MFWRERDDAFEVGEHGRFRLARQAKHQVKVDVVEARVACHADSRSRFLRTVNATKRREAVIIEALNTKTEAVDARLVVTPEVCGVCRSWVGLQGNLGVGDQQVLLTEFIKDLGYRH